MAKSLEGLVSGLFDLVGDKEHSVKETSCGSLVSIGRHQPQIVLNATHAYLGRNPKLCASHRGRLLNVMDLICQEKGSSLNEEQASIVANLATQEMHMAKVDDTDWWEAASALLVTLSRWHCNSVMECLLQKFQPGIAPTLPVVTTLGHIAVTNAFAFVPFLSDILSRAVPMLHNLKPEPMKKAFAIALMQFCESILEYVSNIEQAPDKTVKKSVYSEQITAAYESIYGWISAKDYKVLKITSPKVRTAVVHCLGEMCHLLAPAKLQEELKKLIPAMLALYKKTLEHQYVTQGLCRLLEAAVEDDNCPIESYLEDIWISLFPQVCDEVDYSSPSQAKNQNEILRCFHVTATRFADKLTYYLVQKMQSQHEKQRIGAISVLRHLVNSSGPFLIDKKSVVIFGIKPVLADPGTNKVRKALSLLAVALADHGYLDIEGGSLVIEFLVKHLIIDENPANNKKMNIDGDVANIALQSQCARALLTIANTVQSADKLLWPHLFEFVCVESCTSALPDLYRCLGTVAAKLSLDQRMTYLDLPDKNDLIPGPCQLLARLVVTLVMAQASDAKRSYAGLLLLKEMVPVFHESLPSLWANMIPELQACLDGICSGEKGTIAEWDTSVLKFLSATCSTVSDGEWRCKLAAALGKQFNLYANYMPEKRFLCRCLGGVMAKIANAQFVVEHMELMFRAVIHSHSEERLGCAQGVGYCASVHIDVVLNKLENIAKWEHQKKSSGILGFIKDNMRSEVDAEMVYLRATLLLCYGFVVHYCPIETLTQRLESTVLRFLKPFIENPKTACIRESLLYTFDLIAQSVHAKHLKADYTFSSRGYLIEQIKEYVKCEVNADMLTSCIRVLACKSSSSLVKLSPPLCDTDIWSLCTVLCHHILPLTSVKFESHNLIYPTSIEDTVNSLNNLFVQILIKSPTVETCSTLIKLLHPWLNSVNAIERERAISCAVLVLTTYYNHAGDCSIGRATEFPLMGSLFARLCPRFCDSVPEIRFKAFEGVNLVFSLSVLSKGHGKDFQDPVIDELKVLRQAVLGESAVSLETIVDVAHIIEQRLPGKQMQMYLSVLFEMLSDKQSQVSCAAACLLRKAIDYRGPTLLNESEKIVETILEKLEETQLQVQSYAEILECLSALAEHHLLIIVHCLLKQPLPYDQWVVDCWQKLARVGTMLPVMVTRLLQVIREVDERPADMLEGTSLKFCRADALSSVSALGQVIKGAEPEEAVICRMPELLCSLLMHCSTLAEQEYPNQCAQMRPQLRKVAACPASLVQSAIRALLVRARCDPVVSHLDQIDVWKDFDDENHYETPMCELAKALTLHHDHLVTPVSNILLPYIESPQENLRIVSVAVLASFVRRLPKVTTPSHVPNGDIKDEALVDQIMQALMKAQADPSIRVRKLSVRGMGNLAHCDAADIDEYTSAALSAMMAGLEDHADHRDEVAVEAMQGLNKLSTVVQPEHMKKILLSVLLRIRPCFEKDSAAVRCVAFNLFGQLSQFAEGEAFVEQLHSNLVAFILHLYDEEQTVTKACIYTLRSVEHRLASAKFSEAMIRHLGDDSVTTNYKLCAKDFAHAMVRDFGDKVNFYCLSCSNYFKSVSPRIRSNAALFTGYLLGGCPANIRNTISTDLIFAGLSHLLHEQDKQVKLSTAEAIANLYAF